VTAALGIIINQRRLILGMSKRRKSGKNRKHEKLAKMGNKDLTQTVLRLFCQSAKFFARKNSINYYSKTKGFNFRIIIKQFKILLHKIS